ncbi:XRE family transcriptional regulator [Raoultella ornithinolytica]|uniref:XRE family transcriptional regulator n=1 Tax=Raoultella ornithinolytica TaxID=54291 RepID=UPI001BD9453E|nr:S24 family peptidase [Raoultella ornithinolytica]
MQMVDKKKSVTQFSDRLKSIVPSGSGREFAKRAGIGYSTVHNYLQAVSSPTLENLVLLARAGGVSVEWLATGQNLATAVGLSENGRVIEVPFFGECNFLLLDKNTFPTLNTEAKDLMALRVDTDVMEPTILTHSVLIIDQSQKQLKEGKVVVLRKGSSFLYKRVQIVADGYCLKSDNDKYNEIFVDENSVSSFDIIGQVLAVMNYL